MPKSLTEQLKDAKAVIKDQSTLIKELKADHQERAEELEGELEKSIGDARTEAARARKAEDRASRLQRELSESTHSLYFARGYLAAVRDRDGAENKNPNGNDSRDFIDQIISDSFESVPF